ncbi:hypothetical protein BB559_000147 [Furculomyces boomerangus]|uniref:W2 domain-containing protein n=1 Tax=Furculomyces boomerangus TaxID=61424 RepID=A0A2T9Z6C0_9FUNG|nr:hypothetical protein BB559_000147 [Furculomyces boomerangus]
MSTQQNQPKPSLNGVKIKTRKRVNKANAKFEPEVFRDSLFELIANVPEADLDKYSNIIDTAGNTLDYRRYGETFFELLVSGGLIAPGGIIEYDEEYGEIPFCLFKLSNAEDPLPGARDWVNLVTKLTRRYKYLEKIFSETSKGIIEYVNRYSEENNKKLAAGFGLLIAEGFIYPDVIKVLQKDHLVKDGYALHVLTMLMKAYLTKRSVLNLFTALHKFKADDLIEFFPLNKRSDEYFIRHFESEDMHQIIKYKLAIQANDAREIILQEVVDLMNESEGKAPISEIIKIGRKTMAQNQLTENEVVVLLWDAVMGNVRWGMRSEVIEQQALAEVKEYADAFAPFTSSPKSEMALLKHIQIYCYEDAKLMRLFYQIVRILYTEDVLSHDAIIFWYSKGALPQGKSTFMKQMERFVVHLQSLDSESEDEDDEDFAMVSLTVTRTCNRERNTQYRDNGLQYLDSKLGTTPVSALSIISNLGVRLHSEPEYADAFAPFTSSPKSEMALLKHIQIYCYEDAKLMRLFYQIVRILYTEDVLSHDAIIFWYSKGALPQGKSTFMKQMERFVVHLQSLDSESEDEDDEDFAMVSLTVTRTCNRERNTQYRDNGLQYLDSKLGTTPVSALSIISNLGVRLHSEPVRNWAVLLLLLTQDALGTECLLRRLQTTQQVSI